MNTSKFSALALPTSPRGTGRRPTGTAIQLPPCRVYVHTCFHTATAAGRARSERTKIDEREDAS